MNAPQLRNTLVTLYTILFTILPHCGFANAELCTPATPQELCAEAPPGLPAGDCLELATWLLEFQNTVCGLTLGDPDYHPGYAAVSTYANGNSGAGLLGPGNLNNLESELDRLAAMGVSVIRLDITYPLLTQAFHDYLSSIDGTYDRTVNDYLSFYIEAVSQIRARGFRLHIEHSTMIPSISVNSPVGYFDDVKATGPGLERWRYAIERAYENYLLLTQLAPDYLSIAVEVETENDSFGTIEGEVLFTPEQWRDYVQFAILWLPPHPGTQLGAGVGVWDNEEYVDLFGALPELDYIDFHFFPGDNLFQSYYEQLGVLVDKVRSEYPEKGVTIGESWLYKITGEELITAHPGIPEILSRDVYSYFEPLDQKFIELFSFFSRAKQIEVFTPYWTRQFFTYLDYEDVSQLTPVERIRQADFVALDNMRNGLMTGTAQLYKSIALQTNILVVNDVSPDNGPETGPGVNQTVTIGGENFASGIPTSVTFGSNAASNVQVLDNTTLTVLVPAGVGAVDVTLYWDGGRVRSKPGAYFYNPPPVVNTLLPDSGHEAGGRLVVIQGANFETGSTTTQVNFGNLPATEITVHSSTIMSLRTPPGVGLGTVDVSVGNADLQWGVLEDAYTFGPPPEILSVDPPSGPTAGGTPVSINGKNFFPGSTDTRVWIGGQEVLDVTVISSEAIEVVTPPGLGMVNVLVVNPDFQWDELSGAFSYLQSPTIMDVIPGRESKRAVTSYGSQVTIFSRAQP